MLSLGFELYCKFIKWDRFIKLNAYFHWLLKIRNWKQHFACFQFSSQIEFWEQFFFSVHFELSKNFFSFKNRNLFFKTENKEKKQFQKNDCQKLFWQFFSFPIKVMSKLFLNRLLTSALRTLINITLKYNIIFTSFIKDTIIILRDCNQQVILGSPKKKKKKSF